MRHLLIKETADGRERGPLDFSWNEAAVNADDLLHKAGFAHGDVSGAHDTGADRGALRKQSEVGSVAIEQVAQLAKFYAAGTPPDEEFRSLKERIDVAGDGAHPAPNEWRTSEENRSTGPTHNPDTARDTFNQRIEMDSEKSDLSDGLRALESSIRISAGNRALVRGGIYRTLVLFLFTGLIALGATFVWHYHGNDTKEMVGRWVLPVDRLLSVSAEKEPPAPAAAATPPELVRQEAIAPDIAATRSSEQSGVQQEQRYSDIPTKQGVEQNTKSKTSSPPPHSRAKPTPVLETRPTTIEGWMLREVTNGTAVLEGPNGIWRVKRGDTVPGVGRVESIVLWGKRWIVATSSGLISTP
jgi:hypothetical protein